jgi:cell surface protein SprA
LASKPEKYTDPFNTVPPNNDITEGYGRGLLSWYNIDPRFWGVGGKAPAGITPQSVSNHASRRVQFLKFITTEILWRVNKRLPIPLIFRIILRKRTLQRKSGYGNNSTEMGGIMRPISVSNFVNSNIEYVEFWMMDPYADGKPWVTESKTYYCI